jgi:hypothetical protein
MSNRSKSAFCGSSSGANTAAAESKPASNNAVEKKYIQANALARSLGWFSLGLGAVQFFAPRTVARLSGVQQPGIWQLCGLREIATGLGILSSARPTAWMWTRVAGDAMDLATLGKAESPEPAKVAALAVLGVTALDMICALQFSASDLLEK